MSDPKAGLPQSVEMEWDEPIQFNCVEIVFDTNMNRRVRLPLYRYPECVKDYSLEFNQGGVWKELLREEDNYQRRRVHRFDTVHSNRLRLQVLATNGVPNARVYEIRVYNDPEERA
jgi:hypothetical protein